MQRTKVTVGGYEDKHVTQQHEALNKMLEDHGHRLLGSVPKRASKIQTAVTRKKSNNNNNKKKKGIRIKEYQTAVEHGALLGCTAGAYMWII